MSTVTQIARKVKQPRGGYLPVKDFKISIFNDDNVLNEVENLQPSLVGTVVDYLTRFILSENLYTSFNIPLKGANIIEMSNKAYKLLKKIKGLDDLSIINACKLAGFDVCYRSFIEQYVPVEEIEPDKNTIENIRIMVNRSVSFFKIHGPIVCYEPTFEGGYTYKVNKGDGDLITDDTIWDIKVLKSRITSKHTLQILMYYIMGCHSIHNYFQNINKLGFFNPRTNEIYLCSIPSISQEIIYEIEKEVIGYNDRDLEEYYKIKKIKSKNELTVSEICMLTKLERNKIYKDIKNGKLLATKKGSKYFIKNVDFHNYMEKSTSDDLYNLGENLVKIILIFLAVIVILIIFVAFISLLFR